MQQNFRESCLPGLGNSHMPSQAPERKSGTLKFGIEILSRNTWTPWIPIALNPCDCWKGLHSLALSPNGSLKWGRCLSGQCWPSTGCVPLPLLATRAITRTRVQHGFTGHVHSLLGDRETIEHRAVRPDWLNQKKPEENTWTWILKEGRGI